MDRWIEKEHRDGVNSSIDAFLDEIELVCKKHKLSIAHEDGHGAFIIEELNDKNLKWLRGASDGTK